jgi:hypothetical protein
MNDLGRQARPTRCLQLSSSNRVNPLSLKEAIESPRQFT